MPHCTNVTPFDDVRSLLFPRFAVGRVIFDAGEKEEGNEKVVKEIEM